LRERLSEDKTLIDMSTTVMPSVVYSQYYLTALEFHKSKGTPTQYFTNALLYLQYNPIEQLPEKMQNQLAFDVATAALLGNEIYNFGELLQRKELMSLLDRNDITKNLARMLRVFNDGKIEEFENLFVQVAQSQPLLRVQSAFLWQKLRIMTLIEQVSRRASNDRLLSFDEIKRITRLKSNQEVESLFVKALALKVVRGFVDEIDNTVRFEWVQPRVLAIEEVKQIQKRLSQWSEKITEAERFIETNGQALFA